MASTPSLQRLLSLPEKMAEEFATLQGKCLPEWVVCSDPVGAPLGSGAGTAHVLVESWRRTSGGLPFPQWLRRNRKLIIHAGGQSRRLPAYATVGKVMIPLPIFGAARGQRLDQCLLDVQLPVYERVLRHAPQGTAVLVTRGDVFVQLSRELPPFPQVDVLGIGIQVPANLLKDFGVFFCPRARPGELEFVLHKPTTARVRELAKDYVALLDTGMWLLSERAVAALLARCGWDDRAQQFTMSAPGPLELYSQLGLCLGRRPTICDSQLSALSSAVVTLSESKFLHFGTSSQLIESASALQRLKFDATDPTFGDQECVDKIILNARVDLAGKGKELHNVWVENSVVGAGWQLTSDHVLTGIPENEWRIELDPGVCLDFVPIDQQEFCIRPYGFKDIFIGRLGDPSTLWFGRSATEWFSARHLDLSACGLDALNDIQFAALFPVLPLSRLKAGFVQWLVARIPERSPEFELEWRSLLRLSAFQAATQANLPRLFEQRSRSRQPALLPMRTNYRTSGFFRMDLDSTARVLATTDQPVPALAFNERDDPMYPVHDLMFQSAVLRYRNRPDWAEVEAQAFAQLREIVARSVWSSPALPRRNILEDQIVWGRSPARLDLAGAWTDTPPYCFEQGGRVLNVAADLNGQPPIQVFAKLSPRPEFFLRSIDLGLEQRVLTYAELEHLDGPDNPFSLVKAALALVGFLPKFFQNTAFASLESQLKDFGGGLEISLLCAAPKGSGLGTNGILAATALSTLAEVCGLNWDREMVFNRTMALQQMLGTTSGWQDQAGAIFPGVKLIQTAPGLTQRPTLRWLPNHLFGPEYVNRSTLLYYTGVTWPAQNTLAELVRGVFLNASACLRTIDEMGANAELASEAIQSCDYSKLMGAIRHSWMFTQRLHAEITSPCIERILRQVDDFLGAAKMLGTDGGGYLLLFAKDETAGSRIKRELLENPPNSCARFVGFSLSEAGLRVSRS